MLDRLVTDKCTWIKTQHGFNLSMSRLDSTVAFKLREWMKRKFNEDEDVDGVEQ